MRKNASILLAVIALGTHLLFGAGPVIAAEVSPDGSVTAYYFHGTFRCPTCQKMERYSQEAIENNFKDALDSGKLVFKAVNIENNGNKHFVKDYQLYTKSLVLSLAKDGKEVRSKNLDMIWEYVGNKERYEKYVRDEVAAFLREA